MALTAHRLASFPVVLLAAAVSAQPPSLAARAMAGGQHNVTFQGAAAEALFKQSRNAVGGEAAVMNVSSFVMKGVLRVSAGDDGPPEREVEIRVLLPDQYVRIETAKDWSKRSGFSGGRLLTEITKGGSTDRPPANMTAALLRGERGRFARLLLGLASMVSPEVWLTLTQPAAPGVAGQFGTSHAADAPSARVLQATARDNFMAQVHYGVSGAPLRVDYEANRRRIATAFSDRRKVGPLMLPHTITTTLDGMPLEEITITAIVINPPLTSADFASR